MDCYSGYFICWWRSRREVFLSGRIDPRTLKSTRLTVLHDSTLIWHQGGASKLSQLNSLQVLVGAAEVGDCDFNIDWETTEALYEKGGTVKDWLEACEMHQDLLASRPPNGQMLLWLDTGNSWAIKELTATSKQIQCEQYRRLAFMQTQHFDRII